MAAVRLKAEHKSYSGVLWEYQIYDEEYTGSADTVQTNGGSIKWMQEGDEMLEPIKSSQATITIYKRDDYTSAFDSFVSQLVLADEFRFKLKIYKDGNLYWVGNILTDNCSWDNDSTPYEFNVVAVDGIGRLKDIEMVVDEYSTAGAKTILEHIKTILDKSDLIQFWGNSDILFKDTVNWYETQMMRQVPTHSPFLETKAYRGLFIKDRSDRTKRYTYFECLEGLLKLFAARIMMVDGVYRIDQVSAYEDSSLYERSITKSLTIDSSTNISPRQSVDLDTGDLRPLSGGQFSYFPALLEVKAEGKSPNTLSSENISQVTNSNISTARVDSIVGLGILGSTGDERLNIAFDAIELFSDNTGTRETVFEVELTIKVGNYYLRNKQNINYYPDYEWHFYTGAFLPTVTMRIKPDQYGFNGKKHNISITSPVIPSGQHISSSVTIELFVSGLYPTSIISGSTGYRMRMEDAVVSIIKDGEAIKPKRHKVKNEAGIPSSVVLDKGKFLISQTGSIFYGSSLLIKDTSGDFIIGNVWNAIGANQYATDRKIIDLVLEEAMALQNRPVIKWSQSITGGSEYPSICYPLTYDGLVWMFNGGQLEMNTDTVTGEWFRLLVSRAAPVLGDPEDIDDGIDFGFGKAKPPKDTKDMLQGLMSVRSLTRNTEAILAGTITSIDIEALQGSIVKDGDTLTLISPQTFEPIETFVVSADADDGDTTVSVESKTTSIDIPAGMIVKWDERAIKGSEELRANVLNITDSPIPSSPTDGMGKPGDVVIDPVGGAVYVRFSTGAFTNPWWKLELTQSGW